MKQGGWRRRPRPRRARRAFGPGRGPGLVARAGLADRGGAGGRVGPSAHRGRRRQADAIGGYRISGPTLENRSTGRTGPSFSPARGLERDARLERAQTAWTRAAPIPADPEHPARRWMARRHRWRPDLELPPSVRWLPAGRWRWHNGQMAGAIVAAFGRPNEGQLSGVQLIHVARAWPTPWRWPRGHPGQRYACVARQATATTRWPGWLATRSLRR